MTRPALFPGVIVCALISGCQSQLSSLAPEQASSNATDPAARGWLGVQSRGDITQACYQDGAGDRPILPPPVTPPHQAADCDRCEANAEPAANVATMPHELAKVSLPPYVIEPPDVLLIDAVRLLPRPRYKLEPMDLIGIQAVNTPPNQPIAGTYAISPEGTVNLRYSYGVVPVAGMSIDEAQVAIDKHLGRILQHPEVAVSLVQCRGSQQTRGEHLVRPDGTISLGSYGAVYLAGFTIEEAKCAIEAHLSQWLLNPEISLDILAYNSKVYYVITNRAGCAEQVLRFPSTGNETVLDAISQVHGLPAVASRCRIWIARPAPGSCPCDQILPVDWRAISEGGSICTNYQVFPGDRIYVKAGCPSRGDNLLDKVVAPVERLLGITLLGTTVANGVRD
jgi:protein involved in polysaccharide export with SLBB domain